MMQPVSDPICGHCGKPRSMHWVEDQTYCFENTNGDLFTNEPSDETMAHFIQARDPSAFDFLVKEWKRENGHIVE